MYSSDIKASRVPPEALEDRIVIDLPLSVARELIAVLRNVNCRKSTSSRLGQLYAHLNVYLSLGPCPEIDVKFVPRDRRSPYGCKLADFMGDTEIVVTSQQKSP